MRTSEMSTIAVRHLDLAAGRVWIGGSSKTEPRWGQLTDWGVAALARRVDALGVEAAGGVPLVYDGSGSPESRQVSACVAIGETLRRAGLGCEADVRPVSVAAWAGVQVFEATGHIEAVATALGIRSLDRAARLIGWDWTTAQGADA